MWEVGSCWAALQLGMWLGLELALNPGGRESLGRWMGRETGTRPEEVGTRWAA